VEWGGWSRDGRDVASAGGDGTVKVWEAATGQVIFTAPRNFEPTGEPGDIHPWSNTLAFSPDGTFLAGAGGDARGDVRVWRLASGQEVLTLRGHTRGVNSVAFNPDGGRIATGSNDGMIKLWD